MCKSNTNENKSLEIALSDIKVLWSSSKSQWGRIRFFCLYFHGNQSIK